VGGEEDDDEEEEEGESEKKFLDTWYKCANGYRIMRSL